MSTNSETKTKPQAFIWKAEDLRSEMQFLAGAWHIPEGADDPFEEECAEIIRRAREAEQAELVFRGRAG